MSRPMRRRSAATTHHSDEGPFVSFTDLFIGILFLFLILVAALMLMHQEAVQKWLEEAKEYNRQITLRQDKLDAIAKLDAERPPYRLSIVYNSYQKPAGEDEWTYSRTVQVYRSPNGLCLNNIILRNYLNLAWRPPIEAESIPTPRNQDFVRTAIPCTLTASEDRWDSEAETGRVQRVSSNLYSGSTALHKKDGDARIDIQYRVLGVYDDYYRR